MISQSDRRTIDRNMEIQRESLQKIVNKIGFDTKVLIKYWNEKLPTKKIKFVRSELMEQMRHGEKIRSILSKFSENQSNSFEQEAEKVYHTLSAIEVNQVTLYESLQQVLFSKKINAAAQKVTHIWHKKFRVIINAYDTQVFKWSEIIEKCKNSQLIRIFDEIDDKKCNYLQKVENNTTKAINIAFSKIDSFNQIRKIFRETLVNISTVLLHVKKTVFSKLKLFVKMHKKLWSYKEIKFQKTAERHMKPTYLELHDDNANALDNEQIRAVNKSKARIFGCYEKIGTIWKVRKKKQIKGTIIS